MREATANNVRVATFGDVNIDVILDVDDLPGRGEEVFSSRRQELLGGSAVNTAVVLTRLGLEAAVMGAVGDDDAGRRAISGLRSIGVDTGLTSRAPTLPTAMNTILITPDRERTMIGARGANVSYTLGSGWHEQVAWLHMSGYALMEGSQRESALEALETAARHDIPMSLDVPAGVGGRIRSLVAERLPGLRILAGSRAALAEVTGSSDPLERLSGEATWVAVTSGTDPLVLAHPDGQVTLTPPVVDSADATGAGDALVAGLITAALHGLDPGPSAVLGAAAGAAATLVSGASETLASPGTWGYVLDAERWSDADPAWLAEARAFAERIGETADTP